MRRPHPSRPRRPRAAPALTPAQAALAAALQHLRRRAGTPPYRHLAARVGLSHAAAHYLIRYGRARAVSAASFDAIVTRLGGYAAEFDDLWHAARAENIDTQPERA